jgi:polysaccharide biosynthesis/export protein
MGLVVYRTAGAIAVIGALALGGCMWLPSAGPTTKAVIDQATENGRPQFEIVNVDPNVVKVLASQPVPSFYTVFGRDGLPPEPKIGIGDSISIMIWEAGGNGLFSQSSMLSSVPGTNSMSTGSRPATIPDQIVERDGAITLPFDGRVPAVGRTPLELQRDIQRRLQGKAVDPQVIVSISDSIANTVTVSGAVGKSSLIPLSPHGEHLLDVIASAGGYQTPDYETFVKLTRRGVTVTIPLTTLIDDPVENIYAWPGDTLTLAPVPRVFEAFGATAKNADIPFDSGTMTLAQALGKAAGLLDERADPAGVFLIRYEPASVVAQLTGHGQPTQAGQMPVVYHLDFNDLKSYFLAQQFTVRDKDIIYVANASANTIQKFFQLLGTLTNPIVTGFVIKGQT